MPGLSSLLENKLFLSYLSSAGSSISQGKSIAPGINQITQQHIQTKNYTNLLKKLLAKQSGGENNLSPEHINTISKTLAGGGKVSIDNKNFNLTGPTHLLGTGKDNSANQVSQLPDTQSTPVAPTTPTTQPTQTTQSNTNPFANLGPGDLAGLTPAMISNALSQSTNINQTTPTYSVPGLDAKLTRAEYIKAKSTQPKKTNEIKNYEYAVNQGFKGSSIDFKNAAETTHMKDYKAAVKDGGYTGDFNSWLYDMAKAGAINLGDIVARKSATSDISAQKYFTSPTGLSKDIDKYMNSNEVQNKLFQITDPKKLKIATSQEKENYIVSKITASGGKIQSSRLDGTTFVWDVEWPDGKTSEVRHAN